MNKITDGKFIPYCVNEAFSGCAYWLSGFCTMFIDDYIKDPETEWYKCKEDFLADLEED